MKFDPTHSTSKPLAAEGFLSYRYKGTFGWIMIGAKDDHDALAEARRSTSSPVQLENLQKWDGVAYVAAQKPAPHEMDKLTVEAHITARLVDLGWTASEGTAIATKPFQTAVGPKEAHVYFQGGGGDDPNRTLMGDYQSEGRNALEGCSVLIPKNAISDEVKRLVTNFVAGAEAAVKNTYAARLHRPRM